MKMFLKICGVIALIVVARLILVISPLSATEVDGKLVIDFDDFSTKGLLGTEDSMAYRAHEIERHFHSYERWFGLHGSPSGEVTRMQEIGATVTPFTVGAGDNTWGTWFQVVGSGDTPVDGTNPYFDAHRFYIVTVQRNTAIHFIQFGCDVSGAAALSNMNYSELVYKPNTVQSSSSPLVINMRRVDATTKCWIRTWVVGQASGTLGFFIGIHEYEG